MICSGKLISGVFMKKIIVIFLFLPIVISFGQVEYSGQKIGKQFNPKFYIDFINSQSSTKGKTKVGLLIQVPYSSVQFKNRSKGYAAKYSVSLTFFDAENKNVILEKLWTEKIFTKNYKQTFSKSSSNISFRSLNLVPGEYNVVCLIEDKNSTNPITFKSKVKVRGFFNAKSKNQHLEISDIMFVKKRIVRNGKESLVPNVSHIFSPDAKTIELYYEIYSDTVRTVTILNTVNDLTRDKSFRQSQTINLTKGKNPINSFLNDAKLSLGKFNIVIKVKDETGNVLTGIKNKFNVLIPNLPISLENLDDAIEQMKYIAGSSAIDSIEDAPTYDAKLKLFLAYWQKKDPDPATSENEVMNEYYRRIDYSSKNFKSYNNGWNTDMGMVYVTLGPPDQVERNPMAIDTKPYEIWHYYNLNRQFVFQDETGFGDYRLLNPQYGDWNRYRQ